MLANALPARSANNRWSAVGVPSDAIWSVVPEPGSPSTLWAVAPESLYRSTNAGATWQMRMNGLPDTQYIGLRDIIFDPSQAGTALLLSASKLWRTTDGGNSWTLLPGLVGNYSLSFEVVRDPFVAGTFYLSAHDAMLRSTDHGSTWQSIGVAPTTGLFESTVAMAADPSVPGRFYLMRSSGRFVVTSDYGATWHVGGAGLPGISSATLRAAADASHTLYLSNGQGLYLSHDGGMNWQISSLATSHAGEIVIDPTNPAVVYVLGNGELISRSADSGASWQTIDGHLAGLGTYAVSSLAVDPANSARLWTGVGVGVLASIDGGQTWALSNAGMSQKFGGCEVVIAASTHTLYTIDISHSSAVLWRSTDDGATWTPINPEPSLIAPFPSAHGLALDPTNETTIYAATSDGVFTSHDGGSSWSSSNVGLTNLSMGAIAVDPVHPQILYASGQDGLFRSTDGAASWSLQNASLANVTIQVDPSQPATLYFSGGRWKSTDSGSTFAATPPAIEVENAPGTTTVFHMSLAIDPTVSGRAYVGLYAYNSTGSSGTLFAELDLTTDYLDTTTLLSSGRTWALAVDPDDAAIVYQTREDSGLVERSLDYAATFQPLGSSFYPATPCSVQSAPDTGAVYASTFGGVHGDTLYELTPAPCASDSDCDHTDPCMVQTCTGDLCVSSMADGSACTKCGVTGTCYYGICLTTGGCSDDNACTADYCAIPGECAHYATPGCTPCHNNSECDDGEPCTYDNCLSGICSNPPLYCNDGDPCTVDSCSAEQCLYTVDLSMCMQTRLLHSGTKLVLKSHGDEVALKFRSRDAGVALAPGAYADPSIAGLAIDVFNPDGSRTHFDVPAGEGSPGWSVDADGDDALYDYKNAMAPDGPSSIETVRESRRTLQIKAPDGAVLPDATATEVGIRVTSGNQVWCALLQTQKTPSAQRFVGDLSIAIPDCSDSSLTP